MYLSHYSYLKEITFVKFSLLHRVCGICDIIYLLVVVTCAPLFIDLTVDYIFR